VNGERQPDTRVDGKRSESRSRLTGARLRVHRARGFSLIEVVAVIALIAIAIGVVTISFSKIFNAAKVQAASRDLVAALRYTRGQAIVKGQESTFNLDLANNSYSAPGRGAVQLPKTMRLNLLTAAQEQTSEMSGNIRFYPDGASTGGHISVLMERTEWRINVDWLTGAITREELHQ
jgi:general secretion pathway protein H